MTEMYAQLSLDVPPAIIQPQVSIADQCIQVLEFLNLKTGRRYRPVPANIRFIAARLKEGASVQDMKCVIALKCREWRDDQVMSKYLRPATLFNATKFAQYEGELGHD
jgi:uncharacterized phage protein (TIGR02220 family)